MNRIIVLSILVLGLGWFSACEKVIEIPLNEGDREIVVEAIGRSMDSTSYIKLSRSGSVYDDSGFEKISGANVVVTDKDGIVYTFLESDLQPGLYLAPDFKVLENNQYDLSVGIDDETITASGVSQTAPMLDSLSFIMNTGGFGGDPGDTTYLVFYHYEDNGSEENYYRIQAWVNGVPDQTIYVNDDLLGNGQPVQAPIFAAEVGPRDTVYIELSTIDEATYTYLSTLSSTLAGGGPFAPSPANPVTNLSDGVGYFGIYMVDTMSIVLP